MVGWKVLISLTYTDDHVLHADAGNVLHTLADTTHCRGLHIDDDQASAGEMLITPGIPLSFLNEKGKTATAIQVRPWIALDAG